MYFRGRALGVDADAVQFLHLAQADLLVHGHIGLEDVLQLATLALVFLEDTQHIGVRQGQHGVEAVLFNFAQRFLEMLGGIVFLHFLAAHPVQHVAVTVEGVVTHDELADLVTKEIYLSHDVNLL